MRASTSYPWCKRRLPIPFTFAYSVGRSVVRDVDSVGQLGTTGGCDESHRRAALWRTRRFSISHNGGEPDVGPTDVLIAVRATSLNPLD